VQATAHAAGWGGSRAGPGAGAAHPRGSREARACRQCRHGLAIHRTRGCASGAAQAGRAGRT
jgi:hypothetical protein